MIMGNPKGKSMENNEKDEIIEIDEFEITNKKLGLQSENKEDLLNEMKQRKNKRKAFMNNNRNCLHFKIYELERGYNL